MCIYIYWAINMVQNMYKNEVLTLNRNRRNQRKISDTQHGDRPKTLKPLCFDQHDNISLANDFIVF